MADARVVATSDVPGGGLAFADLAALLWTLRDSLEMVLFKLSEVRLILTGGSTRWLGRADAELRVALEDMRAVELLRAAEVGQLLSAAGGPPDATLAQLVPTAPEPWPALLAEHRVALSRLLTEIELVAEENRRLLTAGLDERTDPYTIRRPRRSSVADPTALAGFQAALATASGIAQLSLRDFLG